MSKQPKIPNFNPHPPLAQNKKKLRAGSFLDFMVDGKEFQSIIGIDGLTVKLDEEVTKALEKIAEIRKKPVICYIANVLNSAVAAVAPTAINNQDDLPFLEMLNAILKDEKEIDIILVTPGGSAETVDYFVQKLRERFTKISFILPYMAMSAGTIFCLSGDELIMERDNNL